MTVGSIIDVIDSYDGSTNPSPPNPTPPRLLVTTDIPPEFEPIKGTWRFNLSNKSLTVGANRYVFQYGSSRHRYESYKCTKLFIANGNTKNSANVMNFVIL